MTSKFEFDFPIFVQISDSVTVCSCCGKSNLKRTVELSSPDIGQINLGVTCCGRWFNTNLSGNVYYAARRLEKLLRAMDDEALRDILDDIEEESKNW